MERKVTNRQNQDLIDQQKKESINWKDINLRYNQSLNSEKTESNFSKTNSQIYTDSTNKNKAPVKPEPEQKNPQIKIMKYLN